MGGADSAWMDFMIDDLRVYSRVLETHEIRAKAEQFSGGISSDFFRFGCRNCVKTSVGCPESYHVCSSFDLLSEGFQFARSMGWVRS